MKYTAKQEEELMADIWTANIKDDPLNFVKYIFPWNQEGTPLEGFNGPRKWQAKILRDLANHIQKNAGKYDPNMFRLAVASGRGIGKSALVAWLILWVLSTRLGATVIVTIHLTNRLWNS